MRYSSQCIDRLRLNIDRELRSNGGLNPISNLNSVCLKYRDKRMSSNDIAKVQDAFCKALKYDVKLAVRYMYFVNDREDGLGQSYLFGIMMKWLSNNYPYIVGNLLEGINADNSYEAVPGGRLRDLLCLFETPMFSMLLDILVSKLRMDMNAIDSPYLYVSDLCKSLPTKIESENSIGKEIAIRMKWTKEQYESNMKELRSHQHRTRSKKLNIRKPKHCINFNDVFGCGNALVLDLIGNATENMNITIIPDTNKFMTMTTLPKQFLTEKGYEIWSAGDFAMHLVSFFNTRISGPFDGQWIDTKSGKLKSIKYINFDGNKCDIHPFDIYDILLNEVINHNLLTKEIPDYVIYVTNNNADNIISIGESNSYIRSMKIIWESFFGKFPKFVCWDLGKKSFNMELYHDENEIIRLDGFSDDILEMVLTGELDPIKYLKKALSNDKYDDRINKIRL